ncbi:mechanosensitive ion channel domain-containing protein [Thioalbus denitrificans]|uniref:Small conductance mechanosensitive channel n=1 Tax=Thioalbus denitrificans TaxID=547122 RepID=A0A369CDE0_9GAMM|nr:mechanosensitive ion channel domain-containing protein [Thioalbus denitrificans]RCX32052.1 small conductance mechanosensitive channel [Thioalbus denitrificans]
MHRIRHIRTANLIILLLLVFPLLLPAPAGAQPAAEPPAADADVEALIHVLENPDARARLLERLRETAPAAAGDANGAALQGVTADLLGRVSQRFGVLAGELRTVASVVGELPLLLERLPRQWSDPERRSFWLSVLGNLALTLGAGYLAWMLLRVLTRRPRRALAGRVRDTLASRLLAFVPSLMLEIVPVGAFALAAWTALALVDPREQTRLVVLAWVYALIVVQGLRAVVRAVVTPDAPSLRLAAMDDESAHYVDIWTLRLAGTAGYGFFLLQAALLMGLPGDLHAFLLRLLGLVVAVLVVIFILQNREPVATWIRGRPEGAGTPPGAGLQALRNSLARTWHLLAALYTGLLFVIGSLGVPGGFVYLFRGTALTLLVLLLGRGADQVAGRLVELRFRISPELQRQLPGLERRANRYLPILSAVLRAVIYVMAALAVMQAWGLGTLEWLISGPGRAVVAIFVRVAGILLVALAAWEIIGGYLERRLRETGPDGQVLVRSARTRTLMSVARNALLVVVSVVSVLMILSELGINIAPLLAGAGVVGLAVGFGAQKLVQDVITGVFILFQDLMAVGDVVKLGDRAGVVEAISIRSVRLRDLTGTVHTIPFSAIDTVSNLTRDFSFYVFDVGVAYREDVDQVMDLLRAVGDELQADPAFAPLILEPLEVLGVDAFADSAVMIKARIKTVPLKQWSVGREFNRRMKHRFDAEGIEIPFPHLSVYFGADKEGKAPPAFVKLQEPAAGTAAAD